MNCLYQHQWDYFKNSMETPISKVFITNDVGINNFDEDRYEIGLYFEDDNF